MIENNVYLLLIPLILAVIYLSWEVEKRNKVRTTEILIMKMYIVQMILYHMLILVFYFSIELFFIIARTFYALPHILYIIQQQSISN